MNRACLITAILGSWLSLAPFAHGTDTPPPDMHVQLMAESCAPCHGAGGSSLGPGIPSLAGQPKDYFTAAMRRFRTGERPTSVMDRLARGYGDDEIMAMGAYFAARKPVAQSSEVDAALAKKGLKLAYNRCRTCHIDGRLWKQFHENRAFDKNCNKSCHINYGPENDEEMPLIGGQWPDYLVEQMEDFLHGRRKMSERKAKAFKALSDDDVKALAQFYASLTEPRQ